MLCTGARLSLNSLRILLFRLWARALAVLGIVLMGREMLLNNLKLSFHFKLTLIYMWEYFYHLLRLHGAIY